MELPARRKTFNLEKTLVLERTNLLASLATQKVLITEEVNRLLFTVALPMVTAFHQERNLTTKTTLLVKEYAFKMSPDLLTPMQVLN